jgi:hypothetical protein
MYVRNENLQTSKPPRVVLRPAKTSTPHHPETHHTPSHRQRVPHAPKPKRKHCQRVCPVGDCEDGGCPEHCDNVEHDIGPSFPLSPQLVKHITHSSQRRGSACSKPPRAVSRVHGEQQLAARTTVNLDSSLGLNGGLFLPPKQQLRK